MGGNLFLRSLRPPTDRVVALAVEVGEVVCPARGVIDVEQCFTCSGYRGLRAGPTERLICSPSTKAQFAYVPLGFVPR